MRVLVVDPDAQFASLAAERLADDGHDVSVAGNPQQMEALIRARMADIVVVDLSRRRMNGFDVSRELRASHGSQLGLVLVSPNHEADDPEVGELAREIGAMGFFPRPGDLDALAHLLRQPRSVPAAAEKPSAQVSRPAPAKAPRQPQSSKPRRRTVAWDNARILMDLWTGRKTGALQVEGVASGQPVLLRDGGLVDPSAVPLIERALTGGGLTFEEKGVDGVGDWALLGNQVFVRCRAACDESTALGYMTATPVASDQTQMARALTITGPTRRLMGAVDDQSMLQVLLSRIQAAPSEVSADLEALVQLGLLSLRRGAAAQNEPEDSSLDVEVSTADVLALKGARSSADLEGLPAIDHHAVAGAHRKETSQAIALRLQRELSTVENAPPPVVLGVPSDAGTALVDEAAARMRVRYSRLAADEALPESVRTLAERIGRIIAQAHRHFSFQDSAHTGSSDVSERVVDDADRVAVLLEQGRKLIARSEWSAADSVLTEAHRHQLDHPDVLANLGWARLHNPDRTQENRTEEGRDFLLLGEQFDPGNADGQYFLAQFLLASNMLEAAAKRAQRARDSAPGEPARAALYRKIQIKLASLER